MPYVRWEYHESITVFVESVEQAAPERSRIRSVEAAPAGLISSGDAARFRWLAPMAMAAGAAVIHEAGRRQFVPRLGAAVRLLVAHQRRPGLSPGAELLKLPAGDE